MAARLHRWTLLLLSMLAVFVAVSVWRAGHAVAALLLGVCALNLHAFVLAIEFVLMARVNRSDPAPRASVAQHITAWWGEMCAVAAGFGWRQPWRAWAIADNAGADQQGRRGVLLVHGFVCNRGLWNPWLARLRLAEVPFVAVNLEPLFGGIEAYAPIIEAAVRRLEIATGLPPVIVAHSMGGLATRSWLTHQSDEGRVHHVLTLGTPHRGTWLGRWAASPNARQMRLASPWQRALRERERNHDRFTCYYSHCDNIVFPASAATLPGADNRHLPATAHLQMLAHPEPFAELERQLA
jgi:triacylglycerol lipase